MLNVRARTIQREVPPSCLCADTIGICTDGAKSRGATLDGACFTLGLADEASPPVPLLASYRQRRGWARSSGPYVYGLDTSPKPTGTGK